MPETDKFEDNINRQLYMNAATWKVLEEKGVTPEMELTLNFSYSVPSKGQAQSLKSMLEEYGYDVAVNSSGTLFKKTYTVDGVSRQSNLTQGKLDQWVEWMVLAGKESDATFDGWGTAVPKK